MDALSVVIPIYNEQDNIVPLIDEIITALTSVIDYEIVLVDDASKDDSYAIALARAEVDSRVRVLRHAKNHGQSAAVITGVRASRYNWVATLDGDRQNDPQDLVAMLQAVREQQGRPFLCMGHRKQRQDHWLRKVSTRIANGVRSRFLKDQCADSGCGIKIFSRATFLSLPLFRNCHRFLPALFVRAGATVIYQPVNHRPRVAGRSKYGVLNRLFVGIVDLMGVAWLLRRFIELEAETRA